jgi:hypothetical protein
MDWMSTLRYGVILQQERLRRAREPWRGFSIPVPHKWLRAVRAALTPRTKTARRARRPGRDGINPAGGPVLPRDSAPA